MALFFRERTRWQPEVSVSGCELLICPPITPKKFPLGRGELRGYVCRAMNLSHAKSECCGFTLIELLVVAVILAILIAMLFPSRTHNGPSSSSTVQCMHNLKQIDLGFIMYAQDYGNKFPMQVSVQMGGTKDSFFANHAFPHFEKIRPYLSESFYRLLVCPADKARQAVTNSETFNDLNISYFLNVDSQPTNQPAQTLLAGDRNLMSNRQMVKPGLLAVTTSSDMDWSQEIHPHGGNLAFADGHVEFNKIGGLNSVFARQSSATNRLAVP
jgi:prepilin-type N-terminal cleavage/methylation domain-containing protein/prepilin-type processing-associated H-X9-DG protein